jgi:hypothetical protein
MLLADSREVEFVFGIVRLDQVMCDLMSKRKKPVGENWST